MYIYIYVYVYIIIYIILTHLKSGRKGGGSNCVQIKS